MCFGTGLRVCVGLVASVLAWPSFAGGLTLDEALRLADNTAPALAAQNASVQAASSAAIPAGELPDPKLVLGCRTSRWAAPIAAAWTATS